MGKILLLVFGLLAYGPRAFGISQELKGRLGVGMSQQFINEIPALSFKLQRSDSFAYGLLLGLKTSDDHGGVGAGIRLYRILYDEPLLNFYAAGTFAMVTTRNILGSSSGFQLDLTAGSEFHFAGLQSLGFSFEFGFSINHLNDHFTLETIGQSLIAAGIHFYL